MRWQTKPGAPPPGYTYGGRYRPSLLSALQAGYFIARGKPRSLARDGAWALPNMPAAPLVRGLENVPEHGKFVLVANHYERPGLWMAWPAVFVSHLVRLRAGVETHWIAIQEWECFSVFGVPISPNVTRTVFERAYGTYGILAMPPPGAPAAARASTIRAAVQTIRDGGVIGLMPEGTVGPTPELLPAREGVGTFIQLLATAGATVLTVGIYEERGRLVAHFGLPYDPRPPREIAKHERDAWVRERVMKSIVDLVPEALSGLA